MNREKQLVQLANSKAKTKQRKLLAAMEKNKKCAEPLNFLFNKK